MTENRYKCAGKSAAFHIKQIWYLNSSDYSFESFGWLVFSRDCWHDGYIKYGRQKLLTAFMWLHRYDSLNITLQKKNTVRKIIFLNRGFQLKIKSIKWKSFVALIIKWGWEQNCRWKTKLCSHVILETEKRYQIEINTSFFNFKKKSWSNLYNGR